MSLDALPDAETGVDSLDGGGIVDFAAVSWCGGEL